MRSRRYAISILFAAVISITIPNIGIASAATLPTLKGIFVVSDSIINQDCEQPSGYKEVWGCLGENNDEIYISSALPSQLAPYVIGKELGAYYLQQIDSATLLADINPPPQLLETEDIQSISTNDFAFWLLGGTVQGAELQLFQNALRQSLTN